MDEAHGVDSSQDFTECREEFGSYCRFSTWFVLSVELLLISLLSKEDNSALFLFFTCLLCTSVALVSCLSTARAHKEVARPRLWVGCWRWWTHQLTLPDCHMGTAKIVFQQKWENIITQHMRTGAEEASGLVYIWQRSRECELNWGWEMKTN